MHRQELFFCDEPRIGRAQLLDDKALNAAIEANNKQNSGELAERFQVSNETVRYHLHRIAKAYELSKWVPHTLWGTHLLNLYPQANK